MDKKKDANVVNFTEKRNEEIEKKRRSFERIMFDNTLGCYSVIDNLGSIYPVELVDISLDGCLIQVPWNTKNDTKFPLGEEVCFRMYFTRNALIPITVTIKYSKEHKDASNSFYMRYGCEFDKSTQSYDTLESFIKFIYKFSEHSCIDKGDNKVFFL